MNKYSNTADTETDNNKTAKKYAINKFQKHQTIELDKKQIIKYGTNVLFRNKINKDKKENNQIIMADITNEEIKKKTRENLYCGYEKTKKEIAEKERIENERIKIDEMTTQKFLVNLYNIDILLIKKNKPIKHVMYLSSVQVLCFDFVGKNKERVYDVGSLRRLKVLYTSNIVVNLHLLKYTERIVIENRLIGKNDRLFVSEISKLLQTNKKVKVVFSMYKYFDQYIKKNRTLNRTLNKIYKKFIIIEEFK